jgi:hypothetical protein
MVRALISAAASAFQVAVTFRIQQQHGLFLLGAVVTWTGTL